MHPKHLHWQLSIIPHQKRLAAAGQLYLLQRQLLASTLLFAVHADIRAGQGMVLDSTATRLSGRLTFRAVTCSGNNYGASAKRSGLGRAACMVRAARVAGLSG
jgi:hypothetical protein